MSLLSLLLTWQYRSQVLSDYFTAKRILNKSIILYTFSCVWGLSNPCRSCVIFLCILSKNASRPPNDWYTFTLRDGEIFFQRKIPVVMKKWLILSDIYFIRSEIVCVSFTLYRLPYPGEFLPFLWPQLLPLLLFHTALSSLQPPSSRPNSELPEGWERYEGEWVLLFTSVYHIQWTQCLFLRWSCTICKT